MATLGLILGVIVALFLPGFAWSFVFLGKKKLGLPERIVLSFGISIVIVPLTVLLLSYIANVAITLTNVSLTIAALVSLAAVVVIVREKRGGLINGA